MQERNSTNAPFIMDKMLFAEDLMSHFMNKIMWRNTPYSEINVNPVSGKYRDTIYSGFNENVREAVDIIHNSLYHRIKHRFTEFVIQKSVNYGSFVKYEATMREQYFSEGVDAIRFLKYCVFMTILAGCFYERNCFKILDLAVRLIQRRFPDEEMTEVTWDTLNRSVKRFVEQHRNASESSLDNPPNSDSDSSRESSSDDKEDCSCFQTDVTGHSFREVFRNRKRNLKFHGRFCDLGNFPQEKEHCYAVEPGTSKQATLPKESDLVDLSSEIPMDIENARLRNKMKISEIRFSQFMSSPRKSKVLKIGNNSSDDTRDAPIQIHREKTQGFFESQIGWRESANSAGTIGNIMNVRNESSPNLQMLGENNSFLTRTLEEKQNSENGSKVLLDFLGLVGTSAEDLLVRPDYSKEVAFRLQIFRQEVREFFESQGRHYLGVSSLTGNQSATLRNTSSEQNDTNYEMPNINYELLKTALEISEMKINRMQISEKPTAEFPGKVHPNELSTQDFEHYVKEERNKIVTDMDTEDRNTCNQQLLNINYGLLLEELYEDQLPGLRNESTGILDFPDISGEEVSTTYFLDTGSMSVESSGSAFQDREFLDDFESNTDMGMDCTDEHDQRILDAAHEMSKPLGNSEEFCSMQMFEDYSTIFPSSPGCSEASKSLKEKLNRTPEKETEEMFRSK